jgi:hypothetical protein
MSAPPKRSILGDILEYKISYPLWWLGWHLYIAPVMHIGRVGKRMRTRATRRRSDYMYEQELGGL